MRGAAVVAALPAVLREMAEIAAFRVYVTDSLYAQGNAKRLTQRYSDLIEQGGAQEPPSEEEVEAMARRYGITFQE